MNDLDAERARVLPTDFIIPRKLSASQLTPRRPEIRRSRDDSSRAHPPPGISTRRVLPISSDSPAETMKASCSDCHQHSTATSARLHQLRKFVEPMDHVVREALAVGFELEGVAGSGVLDESFRVGRDLLEEAAHRSVVDDAIVTGQGHEGRATQVASGHLSFEIEVSIRQQERHGHIVQRQIVSGDKVAPLIIVGEELGITQWQGDSLEKHISETGETESEEIPFSGLKLRVDTGVKQDQSVDQFRPTTGDDSRQFAAPAQSRKDDRHIGKVGITATPDVIQDLQDIVDEPIGMPRVAAIIGIHSRAATVQK